MRVAFLGMGIMGRPMAANLVKAGHEVSIWNRTAGKDKILEGARTASLLLPTPRAAPKWSGCAFPTPRLSKPCCLAPAASKKRSLNGMIIADSSTISPSATLRFAERVKSARRSLRRRSRNRIENRRRKRPADLHGWRRGIRAGAPLRRSFRRWANKFSPWAKPARARPPSWR